MLVLGILRKEGDWRTSYTPLCILQSIQPRSKMSMTPPKSNAGTPQRPVDSAEQKRDDLMAFSDEDDEEEVKAKEAQMLEDDLLSPVNSDIGSDTDRAAMEKELEEQGLIRKVCIPPQDVRGADEIA